MSDTTDIITKQILQDCTAIIKAHVRPALVETRRDVVEMAYIVGDMRQIRGANGKPLSRQAIADELFHALGEPLCPYVKVVWQQICLSKRRKSLFSKYRKLLAGTRPATAIP